MSVYTTYQNIRIALNNNENNTTLSELVVNELNEEKLKNNADYYCYKLFEISIKNQDEEAAKLLIAKGANVNAKDNRGWTPLHCAAAEHCATATNINEDFAKTKDIITLLIKKGADVNAKSNSDRGSVTPLRLAASRDDDEGIVDLLISKEAEIDDAQNSWVVLRWAIYHNRKETVKSLLDKKINVNIQDDYRWSSLHWAVSSGHKDMVELLINKGANVSARASYPGQNITPLHLIGKGDYEDIGELLIENGADIDAKDDSDKTPLYYAINSGFNQDVIKFLIDKRADIHIKDNNGNTLLHIAAQQGNVDVAQLLIDKGIDIHAEDNFGKTALDVTPKNDLEMMKLLKAYNKTTTESVMPSAESLMQLLIDSNRTNGIIDMRNSTTTEFPQITAVTTTSLNSSQNVKISTALSPASNTAIARGTAHSTFNISENALLVLVGYIIAYIGLKLFSSSPSSVLATPHVDLTSQSKFQKNSSINI